MTKCKQTNFRFPSCKSKKITPDCLGGNITSNGGVLLLKPVDTKLELPRAAARLVSDGSCFAGVNHTELTTSSASEVTSRHHQGRTHEPGTKNRFILSSLEGDPQELYDEVYCPRGDIENRSKEGNNIEARYKGDGRSLPKSRQSSSSRLKHPHRGTPFVSFASSWSKRTAHKIGGLN